MRRVTSIVSMTFFFCLDFGSTLLELFPRLLSLVSAFLDQTPLTSTDSAHKLLGNPLGPVQVPFFSLALKCPVGGGCTILCGHLKRLWIFSHVLHRLRGPMVMTEHVVLPPAFPGTLSSLTSDPQPILGPSFSLTIQHHILDCTADFLFPPLGWPGDTLRF